MVKQKCLAIIPARGGSKRIPKKNRVDFFGKPLIAYTIEAALKSGLFAEVVVSTDDSEIAQLATDYGANVPFLRDTYADDHASVSQVTVYAVEEFEKKTNDTFETVVQLMPNCPLRNAKDIKNAFTYFSDNNHTFQLSCVKFGGLNPWWSFSLEKNGLPNYTFPEKLQSRSQDLPDLFCPTGAIWIANKEALLSSGTFYTPDSRFLEIAWDHGLDIDNYDDLAVAKAIYIRNQNA